MKDLLKEMLRARNVLKFFLIIVLLCIVTSCATSRNDTIDYTYEFNKFKSKSGFSNIVINTYDFKSREIIPAWFSVNGISFGVQQINNKLKPLFIETIPNSKFDIEIYYLHRHTVKVKKFNVKKGDSIVINAYLKENSKH